MQSAARGIREERRPVPHAHSVGLRSGPFSFRPRSRSDAPSRLPALSWPPRTRRARNPGARHGCGRKQAGRNVGLACPHSPETRFHGVATGSGLQGWTFAITSCSSVAWPAPDSCSPQASPARKSKALPRPVSANPAGASTCIPTQSRSSSRRSGTTRGSAAPVLPRTTACGSATHRRSTIWPVTTATAAASSGTVLSGSRRTRSSPWPRWRTWCCTQWGAFRRLLPLHWPSPPETPDFRGSGRVRPKANGEERRRSVTSADGKEGPPSPANPANRPLANAPVPCEYVSLSVAGH